jgi:hypothetical protein
MKKLILVMAAIVALGTLTYRIAGADPYQGGGGYGYGCNGPGYGWKAPDKVSFEAREKFYEATKDLRKQLYEARTDYAEVMAADPVDKTRAQELWSEIFDLEKQIRTLAAEQDVFIGGAGFCLGPNGYYEGAENNYRGGRGRGGYGYRGNCWSAS